MEGLMIILTRLCGFGPPHAVDWTRHDGEPVAPAASAGEFMSAIRDALLSNDTLAKKRVLVTLEAECDRLDRDRDTPTPPEG